MSSACVWDSWNSWDSWAEPAVEWCRRPPDGRRPQRHL